MDGRTITITFIKLNEQDGTKNTVGSYQMFCQVSHVFWKHR